MPHPRTFLKNTSGNIAISFALSLIGLTLAAGSAIDFARWQDAQSELQSVVDAAALAAGAAATTSNATLEKIALDYIGANTAKLSLAESYKPKFSIDKDSERVTVSMDGVVDMAFMSLGGIHTMNVTATSTVQPRRIPLVEAVLVLDTTYSMVGSKISTLKTAAKNLATSILSNSKAKLGIVPFASYVNVGVSRRDEAWANVPKDSSSTSESCSNTYPNKKNCTTTSYPSTCTSTRDGITTTTSCTKSTTTCESNGDPVKVCKMVTSTSKFNGCFGSRAEAYRAVIDQTENKYPGMMNTSCAKEILDLTSKVKDATSKIDSLTVDGETYLPGGILWGWNMLTPDAPLSTALSLPELTAKGGRKVMVIMTDGANTLAPSNKNAGGHGSWTSGTYEGKRYADTLTAELCKNVKKDSIDVYTVLFDVQDKDVEKLLRDCATVPAKSYVAKDASELIAAFDAIAKQLAQTRIVK